jgi:hypothetical protein
MRATAATGALGAAIVRVLRAGTLIAVVGIGVGYVLATAGDRPEPGGRPVTELIAAGGGDAMIGAGLLVLILTPAVALATAALVLARCGERRSALVGFLVVTLLAGGVLVGALIGPPS